MDFEKKIENIKEIIKNLNNDELSLKDGMELYKKGIKEIEEAQKMLQEAQSVFLELKGEKKDNKKKDNK